MRTVRLYLRRTCGQLLTSVSAGCGVALFLSVTSFLFIRALLRAEGTVASVPSLWAAAATTTLPCLAAFLTMRLVADDRRSGRLETVLCAPVAERSYVLGRWAGALAVLTLALGAYLLVPTCVLSHCGALSFDRTQIASFLPGFVALFAAGALCAAVGTCLSALFAEGAVAAAVTLGVCVLVPQAVYRMAFSFSPLVRARMPIYPGEAFLADAGMGLFSTAAFAAVAAFALVALFAAMRLVAATRLAARPLARAFAVAWPVALSALFALLAVACVARIAPTFDWAADDMAPGFSARTRSILAEARGETRVTCFLSRRDAHWRAVRRLLRGFEEAARAAAGVRLKAAFADPRWDLATASRLARANVPAGSVVFERGGRRIVVPAGELDESVAAAAILRLALPALREKIYWTVGHGENRFDAYDPVTGMSALARALRRDGYELQHLDLARVPQVPDDCGVLVTAGARTAFSEDECARLETYLARGGRLMALLDPESPRAGMERLLADWGLRKLPFTVVSPRTTDGTDVIASDFADHVITRPLRGSAVVFRNAAAFETVTNGAPGTALTALVRSDAAAWGESAVDRRPWTHDPATEPAGPLALAVALERGGGHGADLALRPARLVVVGDAGIVADGALASRANANRDFFCNALAWLAGLDAVTAAAIPADVLTTGLDRAGTYRFWRIATAELPLAVFAVFLLGACRRRFA